MRPRKERIEIKRFDEFIVPPFVIEDLNSPNFLSTPLGALVPMMGYQGRALPEMDMNSFDDRFTTAAIRWMSGFLGGGEHGQISRNDAFCDIFHHLGYLSEFSRNRSEDSTVAETRSDRTDKLLGIPVVLTEEKQSDMEGAVGDLRKKFRWLPHYNMLPFVFGVAITTLHLEVITLHKNAATNRIFRADLSTASGRWSCIVTAINMARTIRLFQDQSWIIESPLVFGKWHQRRSKQIRLELSFVEIEHGSVNSFQRMKIFYNATKNVPYLEHLYQQKDAVNDRKLRIKLIPVGCLRMPKDIFELTAAIRNICECLIQLHRIGYVHCDIRWSNIVECNSEWILIDCEFACHLNESDLLMERSSETIRRTHVKDPSKPWDTSFDFHQVALLLRDVADLVQQNQNLVKLQQLLTSGKFTSAQISKQLKKFS